MLSILMTLAPTHAESQLVRGTVVDDGTDLPVGVVDVSLLGPADAVLRTTTSDRDGRFMIGVSTEGEYRLRAERLGYETVTTEPLHIQRDSVLEVVIRISSEAIALDPLEVVGRGESEINRATFEGLYQRRARSPAFGTTRIWVRTDPEMDDGLTVRNFLRFNHSTLRCASFLVRGARAPPGSLGRWLDTPVDELEGLEVYRRAHEAPPALRPVGAASGRCGTIVIWPRQWGDEPW